LTLAPELEECKFDPRLLWCRAAACWEVRRSLGIQRPERLAAGPLPLAQLAAAVGVEPEALVRVLRLAADHHIVTFEQDRVGLTDRGRLLTRAHPSSLQAAFAAVGGSDVAHG
jgi:hypothetical protein